jgi:hypothetical protein
VDIQAMILLIFATFHLEGFSTRARLLHARAIGMARDLRLHRMDAAAQPHTSVGDTHPRVLLDLELKRRVFWHLAASDWWVMRFRIPIPYAAPPQVLLSDTNHPDC